jgi:hypothetical protein
MRSWIPVAVICILLLLFPVQADIRTVPPGGTVFIGEENLDISESGISSGDQLAWWAPGTSLMETPTDTVTVTSPAHFSAPGSSFLEKEGIWYSLREKTPVLKIKQPKLRVKISDTTSDFDATGKWLPRGHLASFQIESNLYELRTRAGVPGGPVDIRITSPEKSDYSAVSGPQGSFSLTGIPVTSALYDTGPVWNTGGLDSGTYTIQAKGTANELDSNSAAPGTGVSEPITVLIQDINPLSGSGRGVAIGTDDNKSGDKGQEGIPNLTTKTTTFPTQTAGTAPIMPAGIRETNASPAPIIPHATLIPSSASVTEGGTSGPSTAVSQSASGTVLETPVPETPVKPIAPAATVPTPTQTAPLPVLLVILAIIAALAVFYETGRK